jgi:hypothetical protein
MKYTPGTLTSGLIPGGVPRQPANPRAGRKARYGPPTTRTVAVRERLSEPDSSVRRFAVACPGSPRCHRTRLGKLWRGLLARTLC